MNPDAARDQEVSDLVQTRMHVLAAGRELLFAAKGALSFCAKFVEASGTRAPHVKAFFKQAMLVTDDLSEGLKSIDSLRRAASAAVKPIFTMMEQEMRAENRQSAREHGDEEHAAGRTPTGRITTEPSGARMPRRRRTKCT